MTHAAPQAHAPLLQYAPSETRAWLSGDFGWIEDAYGIDESFLAELGLCWLKPVVQLTSAKVHNPPVADLRRVLRRAMGRRSAAGGQTDICFRPLADIPQREL